MGNPAKDASSRRETQARKRVSESYTPIVLWVKPTEGRFQDRDDMFPPEEMLRRKLKEATSESLFFEAAENEPYSEVVTEFDEEWDN